MKKTVIYVLFFAVFVVLVGTSIGNVFVGNAKFEDAPLEEGGWTYAITPWVCDNIVGGWAAWISYGSTLYEPEPITPAIYDEGNIVYQALSATYEEGGAYVFSIDVAIWDNDDVWEIFFYDATTGDHLTHLVSLTSADPGQEPIGVLHQWFRKSVTCVATASEAGHRIGIGFSGTGSYGEGTMFDNATVDIPTTAWGPDPYDGEINVMVDRILSWHTGRDPNHPATPNPSITEHELYMSSGSSTDPNLNYETSITADGDIAQYTPDSPLVREGTYYWRVDEVAGANTLTGDVWMFRVVGTVPVIDEATPADVLVDAGDDVVFTVSAFNPFTGSSDDLGFQWYKVGEPDQTLSDGANYLGVQTASLTVLDAQEADDDEGQYYCVVTNTAGNAESSTSRSAMLTIRKLIGWWKFDETEGSVAADSSVEGGDNSGTVTNPNWSPYGIVDGGGALDCDGSSTWVDTHKFAADLGIDGNKPRSVSAWVHTRGFNNGGIFDVGAKNATQDFCLRTTTTLNEWRIQYWGGDWDFVYPSMETWVHFVHTHGPEGTKIYADGEMIIDWSGKVLDTGDVLTFRIGYFVDGYDVESLFNGLIDDVRLYNYVLEPLEVANLYLAVKPDETVCLSYPSLDFAGPDGEPDCAVDIIDFALMASEWMQCNIIPDCIQ
jgi:hypothetical protein